MLEYVSDNARGPAASLCARLHHRGYNDANLDGKQDRGYRVGAVQLYYGNVVHLLAHILLPLTWYDFLQDHEKVTHFFLSQLYDREADLGIDTTMTIVSEKDDEIPRYDIKVRVPVKSKRTTRGSAVTQVLTYRTTRLINDDGARSFRGSGTRVWEVVPVVNGVEKSKDIHVLKDHWVDDDRQHEGDILKEIMDDSSSDKLAREELAALFLTPIAQGDVYIIDERDGQEKLDSTRRLATRKACIPANATTFSLIIPESYTSSHDARPSDSAKRREPKISDGEYENAEQTGDGMMVFLSAPHVYADN